jgi:CRP-like cAMP-binding protein
MISGRFLMGRGRERLSLEDQIMIENSIADVQLVSARKVLVRRGELVRYSTLVLEGFICRTVDDNQGERQTVGIHVPGDFVDLDGFHFKRFDHDIVTIGPVKIAIFDHDTLARLSERHPRFTQVFWVSTLLDGAMHREWIFRLGRLGAEARIAHLFCELHTRLEMVGLVYDDSFELSLTQVDIGEATGLTNVHVNRVLRSLRERGLLELASRRVHILDRKGLAALGDFDPRFLYASRSDVERADVADKAALNA